MSDSDLGNVGLSGRPRIGQQPAATITNSCLSPRKTCAVGREMYWWRLRARCHPAQVYHSLRRRRWFKAFLSTPLSFAFRVHTHTYIPGSSQLFEHAPTRATGKHCGGLWFRQTRKAARQNVFQTSQRGTQPASRGRRSRAFRIFSPRLCVVCDHEHVRLPPRMCNS